MAGTAVNEALTEGMVCKVNLHLESIRKRLSAFRTDCGGRKQTSRQIERQQRCIDLTKTNGGHSG